MASIVILIAAVLVVVLFLFWHFRQKPAAWMPADAQLQLHREIRRPPRIPFQAEVRITSHGGTETISAQSQDLAIGGMLLKPSMPLSVGQPIHVAFSLPSGMDIDIPAVVCRTVGPSSFGVRFDVMDRQIRTIGEWVEQNRKSA
jgi:hypothetical protein